MSSEGQLNNYAFTVNGDGYELEEIWRNRPNPIVVTAHLPSSIHYLDRIHLVASTQHPRAPFSAAEHGPPGYNQTQYIVVGVIPGGTTTRSTQATRNRQPVGVRVPNNTLRPHDTLPTYRAVAQITSETPRALKLYVLTDVDPATLLCNAHTVAQEAVYYFSEYRSNATNLNSRKRDWNASILQVSVRRSSGTTIPGFTRGVGGNALAHQAPQEALMELEVLLSAFPDTTSPELQGRVQTLVKRLLPDGSPARKDVASFLDGTTGNQLSAADADELMKSMKELWPGIKNVSPEGLMALRLGLMGAKVSVPYHLAYTFTALGCSAAAEKKSAEIVHYVETIANQAELAVGTNVFTANAPTICNDKTSKLVNCLLELQKRARDRALSVANKLDSTHGGRAVALTTNEIYRALIPLVDQSSVRLMIDQLINSCMEEMAKENRALADDIDESVKILERLLEAMTLPK